MATSFGTVMLVTFVVMALLAAGGIAAGRLIAWNKQRRYMKIFRELLKED